MEYNEWGEEMRDGRQAVEKQTHIMLSIGALLKSSDFILSTHGSHWKHLSRRWPSHLLLRRTLWLLYLEQTVGNYINYRGNGRLEGWDFIGAKSELCERVHRRSWEHKVVVLPQTPLTMPLREQCGSMAMFGWEMHFLYDNTCMIPLEDGELATCFALYLWPEFHGPIFIFIFLDKYLPTSAQETWCMFRRSR